VPTAQEPLEARASHAPAARIARSVPQQRREGEAGGRGGSTAAKPPWAARRGGSRQPRAPRRGRRAAASATSRARARDIASNVNVRVAARAGHGCSPGGAAGAGRKHASVLSRVLNESLRETQGRRALCNGIRAPGPGRAQAAMGDGGRGAEKEDTVHASRGVLFFDTRGRDESTAWMQKFHEKFTHQLSAIMGRTSHCTRHAAHPLAPWPPFPSDTCFHTNPLSFPGP
jgi:hypothetical protein